VSPTSTSQEIRQNYLKLSLLYHPDKNQKKVDNLSSDDSDLQTDYFIILNEAYENLKDANRRLKYDKKLNFLKKNKTEILFDSVDLDDMELNEEKMEYTYNCRCGNLFILTYQDLEFGFNQVNCEGCSLILKVDYDVLEDEE
ncbi:Diphthamide biosynthesis protein 4, partial [Clydaea vesicula]